MKRIVMLLLVCLGAVIGLFNVPALAKEPDWAAAYRQVLAERQAQLSAEAGDAIITPELTYLIYDIDKDGTPEMVVKAGNSEAAYHGGIYTFRLGQALQISEELSLGHSAFYSDPDENGIILMHGHMGYASAQRISLRDGCVQELLYEDDLNARRKNDPEAKYVYPGDVIPGSVYLTFCSADLTLPMTHYEEIDRCLKGDLPHAAEAHYPNSDPACFYNLTANNGEVYAVTTDGYSPYPGRIAFEELLRQNVAAKWMKGDLSILSAATADLNGDGQLECVLTASDGSNEMWIVLSEQDGTSYTYVINSTKGFTLKDDGSIHAVSEYITHYRLIFDAQEAFLLALPGA